GRAAPRSARAPRALARGRRSRGLVGRVPRSSRDAVYALGPARHSGVRMPTRRTGYGDGRRPSLLEPHLLHAPPAVDRLVRHEVLHLRPGGVVVEAPGERGADGGLLELSLDRLDEGQAPGRVQLLRLLGDHPRDLLVAIPGVVARRPASVVLEEVR